MVLVVADGSYCDPNCSISVMCVIVCALDPIWEAHHAPVNSVTPHCCTNSNRPSRNRPSCCSAYSGPACARFTTECLGSPIACALNVQIQKRYARPVCVCACVCVCVCDVCVCVCACVCDVCHVLQFSSPCLRFLSSGECLFTQESVHTRECLFTRGSVRLHGGVHVYTGECSHRGVHVYTGECLFTQGCVRSHRRVFVHTGEFFFIQGSVRSHRRVFVHTGECTFTQGSAH